PDTDRCAPMTQRKPDALAAHQLRSPRVLVGLDPPHLRPFDDGMRHRRQARASAVDPHVLASWPEHPVAATRRLTDGLYPARGRLRFARVRASIARSVDR